MTIYSGTVTRSVYLTDKDRIEPNTSFASWVAVRNCPAFAGFPEGTSFASWVAVSDCPAFAGFPEGTSFASWVAVSDCPAFAGFPEGTSFASWVAVRNCPAFAGFPEGTSFASWVAVSDCPAFAWSDNCTFKGEPLPARDVAEARIRKIAATVADQPDRLVMSDWHCGTAHCIAGWAVHQEGAEGYALERRMGGSGDGTRDAGLLLLGIEAAAHFYDNDDSARAWLSSKLENAQ
jgi:hypothetical protein